LNAIGIVVQHCSDIDTYSWTLALHSAGCFFFHRRINSWTRPTAAPQECACRGKVV